MRPRCRCSATSARGRTVAEGTRTLANLDVVIAERETERARIEREQDRAKAAAGGLLAE